MARKNTSRWLQRVIDRVWERTQSEYVRTQNEYELGALTLRFLGLIRRGEQATLDLAAYEAFGCGFNVWRERSLGRQSRMAWELAQLIPDYDPSVESESRLRGPAESRWPVLPMPPSPRPPLEKPVPRVPVPRTGTK